MGVMPPHLIRRATPADAEALADYANALFTEAPPGIYRRKTHVTPDDEAALIGQVQEHPAHLLLVAAAESRVVGMLHFRPLAREQRAHAGEFGMSVARDVRGKGVGRELLQALLDWVEQERRVRRVELEVMADNTAALRLYESLGFALEGRKREAVRRESGYVDLIQMARVWPFEPT